MVEEYTIRPDTKTVVVDSISSAWKNMANRAGIKQKKHNVMPGGNIGKWHSNATLAGYRVKRNKRNDTAFESRRTNR